ncbi:hypothetical protein [Sediminimonas sp.]|jgi:hypothetical protein|uniref:hypothetical protein n=1 Tax=Sediminimonas sp. TaxID=2823379 RepID=UPI0025F518C3|nr:hypothetical protein [Sediminimonas sp.]
MDSDLLLVGGLVIALLALISAIRAYSDGETPRAAAVAMLIGGGMVIWALTQSPEGYTLSDVPRAFVRVLAWIMG